MRKKLQKSNECVWCGDTATTKEHVFPRALGGTKELNVLACRVCQTDISRAELQVSRSSEFALYRFEKGPPPSDPKNPGSGAVSAVYLFPKDEKFGGYPEVAFRSRQRPITLPSIEVEVNTGEARCNGTKLEDVDKLRETVLKVISREPDDNGRVGEIKGELLTEEDSHISSDPDWWPRVFLDVKGQLKIRARDKTEAKQCFAMLLDLLQKGAFRDHSLWRNGEVAAGTPHYAKFRYDGLSIFRVVSKIAYALLCHQVLPKKSESFALRDLSLFIRGKEAKGYKPPVQPVGEPKTFTKYPDYHIAVIEPDKGKLLGTVILYGAVFLVALNVAPPYGTFIRPVIAMSNRDGTRTFLVSDESVENILGEIKEYLKNVSHQITS